MFSRISLALPCLVIGGCAAIAVTAPLSAPARQPLTLGYCVESTAQMNIINRSLSGEQNTARFKQRVAAAVTDIDDYVASHVVQSPHLRLRKLASCTASLPAVPPEDELHLTVDVSGYGSIKPKWKKILIGTGAVEALAQGLLVGSVTQNPWLGIAASTEEMTSEYLTWNGVDWLLGETFAPVTLEGTLTYAKDNKTIWRDSYFVTENDAELAKLGAKEKADKSHQLMASLHAAEDKLLTGLNAYLSKQIL